MALQPGDPSYVEHADIENSGMDRDKSVPHGHPIIGRLCKHPALRKRHPHISGPLHFTNPTRACFELADPHKAAKPKGFVKYKWTARNNRKGRHALVVNQEALHPLSPYRIPPPTASLREICRGIWRMATYYPIWDVSYDVATVFTWGSVVWVINAFFVWMPLVRPESEFRNEILVGGGVTACVGATIFVWGSILLMLEAVNENRTGCFGWAVEQALSDDEERVSDIIRLWPSNTVCTHHHSNRHNLVGLGEHCREEAAAVAPGPITQTWAWWPSMTEVRTHYIHDIGFLASFTQLIAATIFEIAGITALPGINNNMSRAMSVIFYWTPQTVGGTGFIISGALFMLETQSRWYLPAFGTLGWWVGAWNCLGGLGFTLCPAFGYDESSWAQYQASLSTYWGSWAFLIGSAIQWYESLSKYPVEVDNSTARG